MAGGNGDESGRWRELGIRLKQRRALLHPRWRNRRAFARDNHLDYRLIYDIEEARRPNFGVTTLAAIAASYRLGPDSIAAFLEGREFDPAPAAAFADAVPAVLATLNPALIPPEHYASVDADFAVTSDGRRIAAARDAWEAAIWADDAPVPVAQRRVLLAYRRWKIAEGAGQDGPEAS
jgi:hypothetical protein